jgi:hypothetical protein
VAREFGCQLEAWSVFANHYRVIARSPATKDDASSLSDMLSVLHVKTAEWINTLDKTPGRQIWFNFRDTRLTHQRSYLARLNYVHQNAVKHGLVPVANQYPRCWIFVAKLRPADLEKTERIGMVEDQWLQLRKLEDKHRTRTNFFQEAAFLDSAAQNHQISGHLTSKTVVCNPLSSRNDVVAWNGEMWLKIC